MEASCDWLLKTLEQADLSSLRTVLAKHRARDDTFDLLELFSFMPERKITQFSKFLREALTPAIEHINDVLEEEHTQHIAIIRAVSDILWLIVQNRVTILSPSVRDVVVDLHAILLALPEGQAQNQVAKICEWLFHSGDAQRELVVPQTMLYLLLRSFGDESMFVRKDDAKPVRPGGTTADVKRVYKMRDALDMLELSQDVPDTDTIRTLLLRCATSAIYLRLEDGQKFLAHLLTLEDIQEAFFNALLNQLAVIRKSRADFFGRVFLLAWKLENSQSISRMFRTITEKALFAGTEPFASNLRTVLSAFHVNKRIKGVDELLDQTYGPILFKNLMVANPFVRRNAVIILAEAFPIHTPSALMEEIEKAIAFQCGKLLDLLDDPSPIVRRATVQGVCRVLGLLWELVPLATAKKMLQLITTKLAFDSSSAHVRIAVFEGIKFLLDNHFTHGHLAVALPRLGSLIHDNIERVRIVFLDLLVVLKAQRIVSMRYFDVVPVKDLLLRLPNESPPVASRIMNLIVSSYFPQDGRGKTTEEIAANQVRSCYSMLENSNEACRYFYRNLNLYVSPGPICEFALRLSAIAIEAPLITSSTGSRSKQRKRESRKASRRGQGKRPRNRLNDENEEPPDDNILRNRDDLDLQDKKSLDTPVDKATLLDVVADLLVSMSPSLQKSANAELKTYVEEIFAGEALKPLLIPRGNNPQSRAACWRIASCVSPAKVKPITTFWREQLDSALDWHEREGKAIKDHESVVTSLIFCGMRWNKISELGAVFSRWADGAISGHRAPRLSAKSRKTTRKSGRRKNASTLDSQELDTSASGFEARATSLRALRSAALVLTENLELREEFFRCLAMSSQKSGQAMKDFPSGAMQLVSEIRRGCLGAIDYVLDNFDTSSGTRDLPDSALLLQCLTAVWRLVLCAASDTSPSAELLGELQEMLQWCSGVSLLERASKVDESFAYALSSVSVAHCADAIGLGYITGPGLLCVESLVKRVSEYSNGSDPHKMTRPIVELLRLAFQLREQYVFKTSTNDEERESSDRLALEKTMILVLSTSCRMMSSCKVAQNKLTGQPAKLDVLGEFLSDVLISFCVPGSNESFRNTIGGIMQSCFASVDAAEHNFFASVICNILRNLVTGPTRRNNTSLASEVFKEVVIGMKNDAANAEFQRSLANLSCFLTNCIFTFYEDNGAPQPSAVEFFATMEAIFSVEFDNTEKAGTDAETAESLTDARKVLNNLIEMANGTPATEQKDSAADLRFNPAQEEGEEETNEQSQATTQEN